MSQNFAIAIVLVLAGCASDDAEAPAKVEPPPPPDAARIDAAEDARPDASCVECEDFPETCVDGAFCPVDVALSPQQSLLSIAARSESDVWTSGSFGTVLHFDGATWKAEAMPRKETFGALLLRPDEAWLGSSLRSSYAAGRAVVIDGGVAGWLGIGRPGAAHAIRDLWSASGSTRVWAALDETSERLPTLVRVERSEATLAVTDAPGVIANGRATNAIDGVSKDEIWAVGDLGAACRVTAAESDTPAVEYVDTRTDQSLADVSVVSIDEVWAVGTVGTVRRYRGPANGWERVDAPTTAHLRGVKAITANDVWVVGDAATILHYDGARWSRVAVAALDGLRPKLYAVAVLANGRVIVVGQRAILELRKGG